MVNITHVISYHHHNIFFVVVRSTTTDEELGDLTKTHNPEEIDIDDDSDDDEEVEGGWSVETGQEQGWHRSGKSKRVEVGGGGGGESG